MHILTASYLLSINQKICNRINSLADQKISLIIQNLFRNQKFSFIKIIIIGKIPDFVLVLSYIGIHN